MGVATYDVLGKIFKNKKGYEFIVLEFESRSHSGIALYKVKFLKTGYIAHNVSSGRIRNGMVKDHFAPSVFGVGALGYAEGYAKRHESRRLYYTWRNMIRRCYDKNYHAYHWYGEKGVTVCERWLRLDNFLEDVVKLHGYDEEKFEKGEIELDKDMIDYNKKEYSPETCTLLTHAENNKLALQRRWHPDEVA